MKKKQELGRVLYMIRKGFLIMKLFLLIMILGVLQSTASVYSQTKRFSLSEKNVSVRDVLESIEHQSEFRFFYDEGSMNVNDKLSIDVEDYSIDEVLDELLNQKGISYKIMDNNFIVLKMAEDNSLMQQSIKLTGKVTDSSGQALPGVTIVVKGTTNGTISNFDGVYSLADVPSDGIIQFSFVGMKMQEIQVEGKTSIDVVMEENAIGIEEVVAIGYGSVKKSDVTGSTTSVSSDDFNTGAIVSPEQLMQGKVSGVNITLNSGKPGANSVVRIRGGTSVTAGNDPLYVIDGVPVAFSADDFTRNSEDRMSSRANNPLNMLNPSDIKTIDILKDASATAIYGSRGANGVIMITTKRGKNGKHSIEYDSYVSASSIRKKIDILSGDEFRNYLNTHKELISDWDDGGTSTDWQDEIFRTALTHSHNLALTGGNEKTNYRASLGYMNQEGIIISSGLEKIVGRININHKALNDRLSINLNLSNAMLTSDNAPNTESSGGDLTGGIIRDALRFNPTFPVKNSSGEYTFRSVFNQNPIEQADLIDDVTETFRSLGNATIDFKITDCLSFNTNLGFTKEYIDRYYYLPKASKIGEDYGGRASQESRNNISKLLETNLNFNKTFAEKHTVSILAGYSYQDFNYRGTFNRTENFISDATSYNNLDGGLVYDLPQSYRAGNKLISFYGRLNYSFEGKYLVTTSLRRDGSSRFGENNKWGLFPSAALAWRVTEEKFMENQNTFSNLKLRMGYGATGNQDIGNYMSLATLSAGSAKYLMGGEFVTAVGPDQYPNPNLKWETTTQTNIGIDFGLWKNRLNGSLDFYKKNTTDLLLSFQVPQPAVISTTIANVGEIENKGFELELSGVLVQSSKLNWEISGNISRNVNEVISLSNETWKTDEIFTSAVPVPGFVAIHPMVIRPGESMGSFYGYEFIGLDAEGKQQFKDLNDDGEILAGDDQKIIGNYNPDFYYGFSTLVRYGKLSFDMSFMGVHGNQILNATALDISSITKLPAYNITQEALDEGLAYGEASIYSSKWIQDASYLRLDHLTIGYDLTISSVDWIKKANIYITGQNLFVLTKYKGYDPEVREGIDMTTYPRPRNILLGIRVSF